MSLFDDVQMKVLYMIWDEAYSSADGYFNVSAGVGKFTPPDATQFIVRKAIEALAEKKFLDDLGDGVYEISARGIRYVEDQLEISWSDISKFSEELHKIPGTAGDAVPASDRIVSLKDNEPRRKEAVAALDAVIAELDKTNDIGTITADDRDYLRSIVRDGRELLARADRIQIRIVTSTLLPALDWLKTNFTGVAVGTLAGVATLVIAHLFGIG